MKTPVASSSLLSEEKETMSIYNTIGVQVTLYLGSFFFIVGLIGNLLNLCVFSSTNLRNPSIFLLFVSSLSSLVYLISSLLIRVLFLAFRVEFFRRTLFWCKLRVHVGQAAWFISISCMCYAIIDRYFVSSRNWKWRRRSDISRTRRMTIFIVLFWFSHALPVLLIRDDVVDTNGRFRCNSLFVLHISRYVSFFVLPFLATFVPISILILFGFLTYQNLNSIANLQRRQRAQRPLTSMILLQTLFVVVASTPLAALYLYIAFTSAKEKSIEQQRLEILTLDVTLVLYGFPHASSIFAYSFSSVTYRRQLKRLFTFPRRRHRQDVFSPVQITILAVKQRRLSTAT